ncbi:MAG: hypothetical protein FJW30_21845 [Acidobacteria bacterium]|nr:hypothetical protein [Acidobacteriota bacterium]
MIPLLLASLCPFAVTLDPALTKQPASGRLIVLAEAGPASTRPIDAGFLPGDVILIAQEVRNWQPGQTVCVDATAPRFGTPKPDTGHNVMAVLDRDHSFARDRRDGGDYYSNTVHIAAWGKPASLRLSRVEALSKLADTKNVKLVEFRSPVLSEFWKRPIVMRAGVVLPDSAHPPIPVVYHIHGFGDNHSEAWREASRLRDNGFRAAHVFLDGSWVYGHHVFADSVNNGPWATALVTELIPHIEKRFELAPHRYLTGHSSGGWSALWLQVNYPDFFGGAWPTSPDASDFRNFSGIDVTPGSKDNVFKHELIRGTMSFEAFWRMEEVTGAYGGQINSFNWVFGPKGPVPFFDTKTGELNQQALEHWSRYDIARLLRRDWDTLGPKLRGKIRLFVGDRDNFFLNESAKLLCGWLAEKQFQNACEFLPGRDHFSVLNGLLPRIDKEMRLQYERDRSR